MGFDSLIGVEAVLFDMDGTLIRSEDRTDRSVEAFLEGQRISFQGVSMSDFHGMTWAASAAQMQARWPALVDLDVAAALQRAFHNSFVVDPPPPIPGARQAVCAAADVLPVAIVTSSNRETLELVCEQLYITQRLAATIGAEDCTESKPSPQPYQRAAAQLGVDPRACLVFEDSPVGLTSARRAGAHTIAIGGPPTEGLQIADYHQLPQGFFPRIARHSHG